MGWYDKVPSRESIVTIDSRDDIFDHLMRPLFCDDPERWFFTISRDDEYYILWRFVNVPKDDELSSHGIYHNHCMGWLRIIPWDDDRWSQGIIHNRCMWWFFIIPWGDDRWSQGIIHNHFMWCLYILPWEDDRWSHGIIHNHFMWWLYIIPWDVLIPSLGINRNRLLSRFSMSSWDDVTEWSNHLTRVLVNIS